MLCAGSAVAQKDSDKHDDFPNLDRRAPAFHGLTPAAPLGTAANAQAHDRARASLDNKVKHIRIDRDELIGSPVFIGSSDSPLTGPSGAGLAVSQQTLQSIPDSDPYRAVKAFVDEYEPLFGHRSDVLAAARVTRDYVTAHNGMRTIKWQQQLDDIPVF
jgi:hypothetical protein